MHDASRQAIVFLVVICWVLFGGVIAIVARWRLPTAFYCSKGSQSLQKEKRHPDTKKARQLGGLLVQTQARHPGSDALRRFYSIDERGATRWFIVGKVTSTRTVLRACRMRRYRCWQRGIAGPR